MANSNGVSVSSANHDQYSDGRAAKVWELYMGNKSSRTEAYKQWFINAFKEEGVKRVIDLACGTGYALTAQVHSSQSHPTKLCKPKVAAFCMFCKHRFRDAVGRGV